MKKRLPLSILANINHQAEQHRALIEIVNDSTWNLSVKDVDPNSDFYFKFFDSRDQRGYVIQSKPGRFDTIQEKSENVINEAEIIDKFGEWLKIIKTYNDTKTVFDDPIQEFYENNFYEKIFAEDVKGEYQPYEISQQETIEKHLEEVKKFVEENSSNFESDQVVSNLRASCEQIIRQLPKVPRNTVKRRISNVWATITKNGMFKKFFSTAETEFFKKIVQSGYDRTTDFMTNHIDELKTGIEIIKGLLP